MYNQQGDVLLFSESFKKKGLKKIAGSLLHKGQQHHHRLSGGSFQIFSDGKQQFVSIKKAAKLIHEEHGAVSLVKGEYRIGIVMEYDHLAEESRQVID